MSLQIWLPFNNKDSNLGLANVVRTKGTPKYSGGKLGTCLKISSSDSILEYKFSGNPINIQKNISYSFWIKVSADIGTNVPIYFTKTIDSTSTSYATLLSPRTYKSSNNIYMNEDSEYPDLRYSYENWRHITVVSINNKASYYVDGIKLNDQTGSFANNWTNVDTIQFRASSNSINYICDFRLYNHALSEKEVKEISKGLILHYPFNDRMNAEKPIYYDASGYDYNAKASTLQTMPRNLYWSEENVEYSNIYPGYSWEGGNKELICSNFGGGNIAEFEELTISYWLTHDSNINNNRTEILRLRSTYLDDDPIENQSQLNLFTNYCDLNIISAYEASDEFPEDSFTTYECRTKEFTVKIDNKRHLHTIVYNSGVQHHTFPSLQFYLDGKLISEVGNGGSLGYGDVIEGFMGELTIAPSPDGNNSQFTGKLLDLRMYATALSEEDIQELYRTRMNLDNKYNILIDKGGLLEQDYVPNLLEKTNNALVFNSKGSTYGLSFYTQSNCQVSLKNNKVHIYRTPNLTYDGSQASKTMYGGIRLQPFLLTDKIIKDHTYILIYRAKGKTSKGQSKFGFSNNMGWEGHNYGLTTKPSNVSYKLIPDNFNGEDYFYYKFKITDDIMKECTTSYSNFVAGNTYNTYRDFAIGWSYGDTGELGTDIYINDFQLYDLSDNLSVSKLFAITGHYSSLSFGEIDNVIKNYHGTLVGNQINEFV